MEGMVGMSGGFVGGRGKGNGGGDGEMGRWEMGGDRRAGKAAMQTHKYKGNISLMGILEGKKKFQIGYLP